MDSNELYWCISSLQPHIGIYHWTHGISKLKQYTGHEHQELEKIIVITAAGAVNHSVPAMLPTLCVILNFIFQAQGVLLFEEHLHSISEAPTELHDLKNAIIQAGGQRGKKGLIGHINILKLEAMQWLFPIGAPFQHHRVLSLHACQVALLIIKQEAFPHGSG